MYPAVLVETLHVFSILLFLGSTVTGLMAMRENAGNTMKYAGIMSQAGSIMLHGLVVGMKTTPDVIFLAATLCIQFVMLAIVAHSILKSK